VSGNSTSGPLADQPRLNAIHPTCIQHIPQRNGAFQLLEKHIAPWLLAAAGEESGLLRFARRPAQKVNRWV
jgi:hypothetical protein